MNTPTKLGGYVVALVAMFAAAVGVGSAVGPVGAPPPAHSASGEHEDTAGGGHDDHEAEPVVEPPGGLMVSDQGYTLALADDTLAAAPDAPVSFAILGPDGHPVTDYDTEHDKDLHFIAVRRDLVGYQHVHPSLGPDGRWTTSLALEPGSWRVFADFTASEHGENLTLGADVFVAGDYRPRELPEPSTRTRVGAYTVTRDGDLVPGEESELTLSVARDRRPVTDLEPYLAAYGHLVALRSGDLAYLHVHPAGEPGDGQTQPGPGITFYATAPTTGSYRLFLDFKHGGIVRTAEFTVQAEASEGHHS